MVYYDLLDKEKKFWEVYDTYSIVKEVSELKKYCEC